jgi:hypothetical protein
MKLLIVQLSSFSCYFILFGPNILLRTLLSNTLNLFSSLNARDQVSHPYKSNGRIMLLYVFSFIFLDKSGKTKTLYRMVASIPRI